jgi:hypothetical protein
LKNPKGEKKAEKRFEKELTVILRFDSIKKLSQEVPTR